MDAPSNKGEDSVDAEDSSVHAVESKFGESGLKAALSRWRASKHFRASIIVIAGCVGITAALAIYLPWEIGKVRVPDLSGATLVEAEDALRQIGLGAKMQPAVGKEMYEHFEVDSQQPHSSARVVPGSVVRLDAGPRTYTMPALEGASLGEAERTLRDFGLTIGTVTYALPPKLSAEVDAVDAVLESEFGLTRTGSRIVGDVPIDQIGLWTVVHQAVRESDPVEAANSVALTIQIPIVAMPDVVGKSVDETNQQLLELGMTNVMSDEFSAPAGIAGLEALVEAKSAEPDPATWSVSAQSISSGTIVPSSTEVILTVEWPAVPVPDLTGVTHGQAQETLETAGFVPKIEIPNPSDWGVYKQDPAPGAQALWGSAVTYAVKRPTNGTIEFQVSGNGSNATITWVPPRSFSIEQDTDARLPWSQSFDNYDTTAAHERGNFSAQITDGDSVTCRMIVNGQVVKEHTSNGAYAVVLCG